jgi:hypothetical protein
VVDLLDSGALRVAAYAAVALLAGVWWVRERRWTEHHDVDWWPRYWLSSAVLLAVLGVGRSSALGDLISDFGREQARAEGWYDARRAVQLAVVVGVAVIWVVGVAIAILRIPPRRRRYLPHVIAMSSIIAFAAIRLVSLHQIDSVLYRTDLAGIRVVALAELGLLAATALITVVTARFPRSDDTPHPQAHWQPARSDGH